MLQVGNFVLQVKKFKLSNCLDKFLINAFKMGNLFPKLGDLEKTTLVSHLLRSAILRSEYVYLNAKSRFDSSWGRGCFSHTMCGRQIP